MEAAGSIPAAPTRVPLGAYLTGIIHHLAADFFRRSPHPEPELAESAELREPSEEALVERIDLKMALPTLSERTRAILDAFLAGKETSEVARVFGVSEAAVRQVLSRARRILRESRGKS